MNNFSILSTAHAVPDKIVTNDDLAQIMDTSDAWISRRTGIHERRIATHEDTTSLCVEVANKLLSNTNTDPSDIDYIIVGTMSSDYQTPSTAAAVQGAINADNAVAFDINAACSGFVYGMNVLNSLLKTNHHSKGILIGGEVLSKLVDWKDRSTAVLFGDGAGGILATNDSYDGKVLATSLRTYGQLGNSLTAGHFDENNRFNQNGDDKTRFFKMDGHAIFDFATRKVPESISTALNQAHVNASDVKYFVLHQANSRIIQIVARKLKLSLDQFPININHYGNTAAASEPILLDELVKKGKIRKGDIIALSGFGGGLTAGTIILEF
ncbi:3-oxoacyl-[acyl-carrier-protein] synthase 3 [Philodulcilactobacillus myokoensis]|uniref:Beta-ketoacyl-[acyl-carrier-protein] synthase III n=1 Tax=Philodulcilactobacillus myokoensis TaxID=2929573 RepID=A0A9W6B0U3_9LACO|nr:beta-ketoacyl-ACP synthase III [Philodulcilactobacillus myokoensis]GLB46471.1 3-oxoacyl-[acyl-carrier-protein] synthase 3 [Philodulcilactobacillus myokoensis]